MADEPSQPGEPGEADLDKSRMSFMEHLRELRTRVRNSAIALILGFFVAYTFKGEILYFLVKPLMDAMVARGADPELVAQSLYYRDLLEPFWAFISLSLWGGLFIASPLIFYQLWKFISPGLYKRERLLGLAFAVSSAICFIGGALFCYYLVLPSAYEFLLGYATDNIGEIDHAFGLDYTFDYDIALKYEQSLRTYIDLTRNMMIAFGLIFELPVFIGVLAALGMVTHRSLWKFNRWWVLISFIIGAILTPTPDPLTQTLMAGPMIVLYNLSILIAWVITRRREKKQAAL
jgi:sec-independent protein translocase protein TatC